MQDGQSTLTMSYLPDNKFEDSKPSRQKMKADTKRCEAVITKTTPFAVACLKREERCENSTTDIVTETASGNTMGLCSGCLAVFRERNDGDGGFAYEANTEDNKMTTESKVRILSALTTRGSSGRHFTSRVSSDDIAVLEAEKLIVVNRPVHEATGIPYSAEYHTVEVTAAGAELVEAYPKHHEAAE